MYQLAQAFHRSTPSYISKYLDMQISQEPVAAAELNGTQFPIGFRVETVTPGGLAEKAEIQAGDILVSMVHPGAVSTLLLSVVCHDWNSWHHASPTPAVRRPVS